VDALTAICERAVRGEHVVRLDTPPPTTRRRDELAEGASPIHAEPARDARTTAEGGRPAPAAH
jgi:hypothetical protein